MPESVTLSDRERQILHAVVHSYITTAEPVGSRSVVKRFGFDVSAATVRNVMADLEDMGYLQQLHTSSGRVPTDAGYRYYVNHLMKIQELTEAERDQIQREYEQKLGNVEDVLRHTTHLLALTTHQAGLAQAPGEGQARIVRVSLMPLSGERLALLIADNFGRVHSMMTTLETAIPSDRLPGLARFLNDHLAGVAMDEMAGSIQAKLRDFLDEQRRLAQEALSILSLLPTQHRAQLFLDGAGQLFEQPEFKDMTRAREVFDLLDEHDRLLYLMRRAVAESEQNQRAVIIGAEEDGSGIPGIGVVAAPYKVHGQHAGLIGVLGPRRMPYSRLTAIVDYTAGLVGRMIGRMGE